MNLLLAMTSYGADALVLLCVSALFYGVFWFFHHRPQVAAFVAKAKAEEQRLATEADAILIKAKADAALALSQAETMAHNLVSAQAKTPVTDQVPPDATQSAVKSATIAINQA